jgi:peptidoglycan/LPS O-acetylase OafA/YrhL
MSKVFRQDVNGLRAWAVIAVVLYHFGVPGFRGGFIGVDVFFVISGFLMTGIIYNGLAHPSHTSFTLINFYLARGKRIIPALLVLCTVLLFLGWFFLPAIEYELLGKHAFGATTFLSNVIFWREAGYFDSGSQDKWLLHTWSLSVEWQFYIILPLAILIIWRLSPLKSTLITVYIVGLLASLFASIHLTNTDQNSAFYLLPTRAWEMLSGGLIYLLNNKFTRKAPLLKLIELLGFTLITLSIALFDQKTSWPGWQALLPVTGTCLVIIGRQKHSLFSTTKLHDIVGRWSYSIYLWHWPIVVFLVYVDEKSNPLWIVGGLILTLLLGGLSYKYIEKTSSLIIQKFSIKTSLILISALVITIATLALAVKIKNGFNGRIPAHIDEVFNEQLNRNPLIKECHDWVNTKPPECIYGGPTVHAIIIGDSHAAAIVRTAERALNNSNLGILEWTSSSCPTILDVDRLDYPSCRKLNDHARSNINKYTSSVPLIIVSRTSFYFHGQNEDSYIPDDFKAINFQQETSSEKKYHIAVSEGITDTACFFAKNRDVYIMKPIPELKANVPKVMGRSLLTKGKATQVSITKKEYINRNKLANNAISIAKQKCGIKVLDPAPYLCDNNHCYGSKENLPIYTDDDHLSERGANLLLPLFKEIFNN